MAVFCSPVLVDQVPQLPDVRVPHTPWLFSVPQYWSIKYHSYLTFVFLLWALVVAVIKNQRMVMHRSSPFLVLYAQLLVLLQFVYCLDLTDQELPVKINNFDLRDVVYKPPSFPCETLALQVGDGGGGHASARGNGEG